MPGSCCHVIPNALRAIGSAAFSTTASALADSTVAVNETGTLLPAASMVPVLFRLDPSKTAEFTVTVTVGYFSTLKKSADRRWVSRLLFFVFSEAASMTSCPLTDPSSPTVPWPLTVPNAPRTDCMPQNALPTNSTEEPAGSSTQAPAVDSLINSPEIECEGLLEPTLVNRALEPHRGLLPHYGIYSPGYQAAPVTEEIMRNAALLGARLLLGGYMFIHASQKLLGKFHGPGLEGAGALFEKNGLAPGKQMATAAAATEITGGLLTVTGIAYPAGPLAVAGAMTVAAAHNRQGGLMAVRGGVELPVAYATLALTLAAAGPGKYKIGPSLPGKLTALGVLAGAAAAGVLIAKMVTSTPPPAGEPEPAPAPPAPAESAGAAESAEAAESAGAAADD
jgi:putative oxidoreductase